MHNDFLIKDALELTDAAEAHPAVQHYRQALPLGAIWINAHWRYNQLYGTSSYDAIAKTQEILFVHSQSAREAELAVRWYIQRFTPEAVKALPFSGEASDITPEKATVRIDGKKYFHDDFRHHGMLHRMSKALGEKPLSSVVELGAGTGGLARILKGKFPGVRYVIIDLPDTLAYSMMFLRATFPDAKWHWVDGKPFNTTDFDFVFCPVGMETLLYGQHFDAFINTASLGEMKIDAVKHWFAFVQGRCQFDFIFSVNRFLNLITTPHTMAWRREDNTSALQFDAKWDIIDWELVPWFIHCPWQNRHARQALIFGRRRETPLAPDPSQIADALAGSWNPPGEMSIWSPALNEDVTMTGILFKFWDALRRDPGSDTRESLRAFVADHLRQKSAGVFEEEIHL